MKKITSYAKKLGPWLMAALIFWYLFRQYPPQNIYNALKYINIPMFVGVALGYFILMFFLDTFSIARILNRFGYEGSTRELLPARGLTYLIMVINYAAAQAAFAFYQNRRHGIPISKMLGIFGIIVVADLYILATLAFITTFFTSWPFEIAGINIAQFVRIFTLACYAAFIVGVFVSRGALSKLKIFERLHKNKLVELIVNTKFSDYIVIGLYRIPVHVFIMFGMYFAVRTFNAYIPFVKILSNIPLTFFIGALPITPGGLGTSNAALVELFKPFIESPFISNGAISAGDLLFSFSLVWMFANYGMKALTGLICFKFVSKDLFKPTPEVTEAEAEAEAAHIGGNI